MERSLAGRSGSGFGFGPLAVPVRWIPGARLRGTLGSGLRSLLKLLWRRRATRIALIVALAAVPALPGGWLLLRNSSLVAVRSVQVSGVHGPEARAIESALTRAARRMSTLDFNPAALRAAVSPFRVVRSVQGFPKFPHGMRIEVVEQLPVAALVAGGTRTAVAADGVVLGPALLTSSLPTVKGWTAPAVGGQLRDSSLLGAVTILGAAPPSLRKRVERLYMGPHGLTAAMRNGLLVYFGDGSLPHAKWLALAAVLASSSSSGATYVDVRVPSHPAAGFPAGAGPPPAEQTSGSSTESTVGAIAAGLASEGHVKGESAAAGAGETSGESQTGSGEGASTESGEAGSEGPTPGG